MAPWEQLKAAYRHPRDEHTHTHDICCANMSKEIQEFKKVWKSPDFGAKSHLVSGHHLEKCESPPNRSPYHVSEVTSWVNLGEPTSLFPKFLGSLDLQTSFFGAGLDPWAFPAITCFLGVGSPKRSKPVAKTCQDSHFSGLSIEHAFRWLKSH